MMRERYFLFSKPVEEPRRDGEERISGGLPRAGRLKHRSSPKLHGLTFAGSISPKLWSASPRMGVPSSSSDPHEWNPAKGIDRHATALDALAVQGADGLPGLAGIAAKPIARNAPRPICPIENNDAVLARALIALRGLPS